MTDTPFTADSAALLLLDHQVGTMGWVRTLPVDEVKRNTLALAKVAKTLGISVVLTSSMETEMQGPLLPELEQILPEAFEQRIRRTGVINSMADPFFAKAVRDTGRRDLIIAGVTTDVCVISPAIQARAEGYRVQVVVDASGSASQASED
jgi:nicotinamidase-related amidase